MNGNFPVLTDEVLGAGEKILQASIVEIPSLNRVGFKPGQISADTGAAAYDYIQRAIDAALAGQVAAVTTAPINKEALAMAGIKYPGHTEIFADRSGSDRWCMMQYSEEITCAFVTVHVGYADVVKLLTTKRVLEVIELCAEALKRIRSRKPKIVVCGLNPHAGEHGLFGDREEERIIIPAIEAACAKGINVEGPLPPDTAFLPNKRRATDGYVCMYHDQGHIPVKALAFDSAVNLTLGLSIIRTSVDHGTALDIAWQGKADPSSLYSALRLAVQLSYSNGCAALPLG
jgi:4-hydroxythreonine-4-phosphate dehydrogenase